MCNMGRIINTQPNRDGHKDGECGVDCEAPEIGEASHVDNGKENSDQDDERGDEVCDENEGADEDDTERHEDVPDQLRGDDIDSDVVSIRLTGGEHIPAGMRNSKTSIHDNSVVHSAHLCFYGHNPCQSMPSMLMYAP